MEPILLLAQTKVSSKCADSGLGRVCSTDHLSSGLDDIITFPNHRNDWSLSDSPNERLEEGLALMFSIVFLEMSLAWLAHFHGDKFEAAVFKLENEFVDEASLNGIRLKHDECSLTIVICDNSWCLLRSFNLWCGLGSFVSHLD